MKKLLLLILLVLLLGIGGYFGYQSWKRASLLNSGKVLLLLNEEEGFYTYSDFLDVDDVDRNYEILGIYEELSEAEIDELTSGYDLRFGSADLVSDPRVPTLLDREVTVPTEEQRPAWLAIVSALPANQKALCDLVTTADLAQQCLIQHHIYNILRENRPSSDCDGIFLEFQRTSCYEVVEGETDQPNFDRNNNLLVDSFESWSGNGGELREYYQEFFTQ